MRSEVIRDIVYIGRKHLNYFKWTNEFELFYLDKRAFLNCHILLEFIFALMQDLQGEGLWKKRGTILFSFKIIDLEIDTFLKLLYENLLYISS